MQEHKQEHQQRRVQQTRIIESKQRQRTRPSALCCQHHMRRPQHCQHTLHLTTAGLRRNNGRRWPRVRSTAAPRVSLPQALRPVQHATKNTNTLVVLDRGQHGAPNRLRSVDLCSTQPNGNDSLLQHTTKRQRSVDGMAALETWLCNAHCAT